MTTRHRYLPMLAKEAKAAFTDADWIFEVKWDGFRALAYVNEELSLRSRNQKELLDNFPELIELQRQAHGVVLDGEIVILNGGKVDFQALLERGKATSPTEIELRTKQSPAAYIVFDILEKDGKQLLDLPLMERKKILKTAVQEGEHVLLADYVEGKGESYYKAVLQKGLEGVMAKKKNSPYEPGLRSGNWLKIKKLRICDCVIFGYTKGTGVRKRTFGALLLGLYDAEGKWVYTGKVGTGFSEQILDTMLSEFRKIETDVKPFKANVAEKVTWLKPKLVCEVAYQVVTKDGRLRMPRFLRLRTDKEPKDCTTDQLDEGAPLNEYAAKRHFTQTQEPPAQKEPSESGDKEKIFVVQEHHARRLHYDFRLERDGVLKSWAVPRGIPETPEDKRLAVQVEDHPIEYAKFAGQIPAGQYGAGQVIIWDKGTYETKVWDEKMVEVILDGKKLQGRYVLVPLKKVGKNNWLMLRPNQ
jgi:DNA ligase D-like protein (predicted ligase)/DNA ligase D-like protein (predicted 3'-phosphoesterase)